jgi:hypothetical protein
LSNAPRQIDTEVPPDDFPPGEITPGGPLGSELVVVPASARARLIAQIRGRIEGGEDDDDIAAAMGLNEATFRALRAELDRREVARITAKTTEEVYLDYCRFQRGRLRELNELIATLMVAVEPDECLPGQSPTVTIDPKARLGAIKLKSEIADKILEKGQELGVLERAPKRTEVLAGVLVKDMDNTALRRLLVKEMQELDAIVRRYGDNSMLGAPLSGDGPAPTGFTSTPFPADSPIPLPPPDFSAGGKPIFTRGGASKTVGARASNFSRKE